MQWNKPRCFYAWARGPRADTIVAGFQVKSRWKG